MWQYTADLKVRPTCGSRSAGLKRALHVTRRPGLADLEVPYMSLYKADLKVRRNILSANDGVWHM